MRVDFETDDGAGARAAIGLIVLSTDATIEAEFARLFAEDGVALRHARIPMADAVTPETLDAMADRLTETAALLPPGLDAIAYACTSASTVIGSDRVAALIQAAHPGVAVADPIASVEEALRALRAKRIGFVTPYTADVSAAMRGRLEAAGFAIAAFASFEEGDDPTVARITEASTLRAVRAVGFESEIDAVFVACTNLRTLGIIEAAENALGRPVVSSNLALAWALRKLAGLPPHASAPGLLLSSVRVSSAR